MLTSIVLQINPGLTRAITNMQIRTCLQHLRLPELPCSAHSTHLKTGKQEREPDFVCFDFGFSFGTQGPRPLNNPPLDWRATRTRSSPSLRAALCTAHGELRQRRGSRAWSHLQRPGRGPSTPFLLVSRRN